MKIKSTLLLLIGFFGFNLSAQDPNNYSFSVKKNPNDPMGGGDYITLSNSGTIATSDFFTIEAWVKLPASATTSDIFNIYESYTPSIPAWGGVVFRISNLSLSSTVMGSNGGSGPSSTTQLTPGQWHHVALTYNDTSGDQILYLDGVSVGSDTYSLNFNSWSNYIAIGADGNNDLSAPSVGSDFLIDEVRMWSYEKTQTEIVDGMYACNLAWNEPGLVLNLTFNDQDAIDDATAIGTNNGTIIDQDVAGDIWGEGAYCCGFTAAISGFGNTFSSQTSNAVYQWVDCDNGFASLQGETNQSFTPTVSSNYACIVSKNGCTDTTDCVYIDPNASTAGKEALSFDGVDDYINIAPTDMDINTEFTFEAWIKPSKTSYSRLISHFTGAGLPAGNLSFDTYGAPDNGKNLRISIAGSPNFFLTADQVLTLNSWNHVAVTFSFGEVYIYVNGLQVAYNNTGSSTFSPDPNLGWGIGEDPNDGGISEKFLGEMDEIRIWNVARTMQEIQDYKDSCLTGNETGLKLYYSFESIANDTVYSGTNINNGVLINMNQTIVQSVVECPTPPNDTVSSNLTKHSNAKFNLYPNPTNGQFTIVNNSFDNFHVIVKSLTGQNILTREFKSGDYIDLSNYPSGVYLIEVSTKNHIEYIKVIKN